MKVFSSFREKLFIKNVQCHQLFLTNLLRKKSVQTQSLMTENVDIFATCLITRIFDSDLKLKPGGAGGSVGELPQQGLRGNEITILFLSSSEYVFCSLSFQRDIHLLLCLSLHFLGGNFCFCFCHCSHCTLDLCIDNWWSQLHQTSFGSVCLFRLSIWHAMSNQDHILNSIFSIIYLVENFSRQQQTFSAVARL